MWSAGLPAESAGTAERDAMALNCRLLRQCGADIPELGSEGEFAGISLSMPPLVVLLPSFGSSLSDIKRRFSVPPLTPPPVTPPACQCFSQCGAVRWYAR